jgi:MATE family multidrug resistance protein
VKSLMTLGTPAATQILLEVGVFATAGLLAGHITPIAAAANIVVLNVASFTFMVPLGISSAAAVRVGQAIGRSDPAGMRRAGWSALLLGAALMACCAVIYISAPLTLLGIFTTDASVLRVGTTVLYIYAAFQVFDGLQVIATGALRGFGDTRTPMIMSFVCHWLIGLPLACWLCFSRNWGVAGLWFGLSVGLTIVGVVLTIVWHVKSRRA